MPDSISRKEAIKKLGGLALGIPIGLPMVSLAKNSALASPASSFPNIIPKRRPDKPNVLWITTEGVPLSVLSCYGSRYSTIIRTPNIDRIANEGMLFRHSFCNNALCAPSRATLLTGKYNHLCGMESNPYATITSNSITGAHNSFFDPSQETFPKILQKAGYKTGIAGKWHLESAPGKSANPGEAGFDYFVFKEGAGGPYYDSKGYLQNPSLGSKEIQEREYSGYMTDVVTDLSIKGIEALRRSNSPFCFMVQFFNDHNPFEPPHKYEHIYDNVRFPEPGTFWDDYASRSAAAREARMRIANMVNFNPPENYTTRQRQQWSYQRLMQRFLGTLKAQDDNVGRLLDYLDKSGLSENTIVVFTGDHGFFLGDHGWFDKRFMYEEALRVPWLIRYPGVIKPGSTSDAWVQSIDNAPTILDMLGLAVPSDMQGKSLVPVFNNTSTDRRKSMYYHYYEFSPTQWALPNYGIRTERYKLISYYTINEWELFDMERDPDEMESLIMEYGIQAHPGYESVFNDLLKQLTDLREYYKDNTGSPVKFWGGRR